MGTDTLGLIAFTENQSQEASISELLNYVTVEAVENVFTIDMAGKKSINVKAAIIDNVAKSIVVTNPSVGCEIFLELTYTDGGAITYTMSAGSATTWKGGSAPALTDGKRYRMAFFYPATNVWDAASGGEW